MVHDVYRHQPVRVEHGQAQSLQQQLRRLRSSECGPKTSVNGSRQKPMSCGNNGDAATGMTWQTGVTRKPSSSRRGMTSPNKRASALKQTVPSARTGLRWEAGWGVWLSESQCCQGARRVSLILQPPCWKKSMNWAGMRKRGHSEFPTCAGDRS